MALELNGYPLPAGTLAVSLGDDGTVTLHIPGQRADQHTIRLAPSAQGMLALINILTHRRRQPDATIGQGHASPTQGMVEEWLKVHSPRPPVDRVGTALPRTPKTKTELTPSEVDEILEGIDL